MTIFICGRTQYCDHGQVAAVVRIRYSEECGLELARTIDASTLKALINQELERLSDDRVVAHIRSLLVEPRVVLRDWDYSQPRQQHPCWNVLEHSASCGGIAYCESGFGPRCPWGLVWLAGGDGRSMSIGMDSSWYSTFLDAYFESFASTDLPIYRVFKTGASGQRYPITQEDSWDATWDRVRQLRESDPGSRYDCDHSVVINR